MVPREINLFTHLHRARQDCILRGQCEGAAAKHNSRAWWELNSRELHGTDIRVVPARHFELGQRRRSKGNHPSLATEPRCCFLRFLSHPRRRWGLSWICVKTRRTLSSSKTDDGLYRYRTGSLRWSGADQNDLSDKEYSDVISCWGKMMLIWRDLGGAA